MLADLHNIWRNYSTRYRASTDISRSALYCHSNWIRVHRFDCKFAQWCTTRGHPYRSPKLHPGSSRSVGMRRGTDRHTDRRPWLTTIHYA